MTEQKHLAWQDGLPTAPDVEALCRHWPELKPNDRIPYSDVLALLNIKDWRHSRFRTITTAWRRRMRERGIVIECDAGVAFFVATADQVSAGTYGVLKHIGRKAKRQRHKLAITATQKGADLTLAEHQMRLMHAMEKEARKSRMNLLPGSTATPPRIAPPKQVAK